MEKLDSNNKTENHTLQQIYGQFLDGLPVRVPEKILFINIPQVPAGLFNHDVAKLNGYQNYPPVGFLHLAAAARLSIPDVEMSLLDLNHQMLRMSHLGLLGSNIHDFWKGLIANEIDSSRRMHVCVGNMFEATTPTLLEITSFIVESFTDVTVLTGGVQTTQDYKRIIEGGYSHLAFRHEAEMEFKEFLDSCSDPTQFSVPNGIAFKQAGVFYETASPPVSVSQFLDIVPYYSMIDVESYHEYGGMNPYTRYVGKEKVFATVLSNRGCRARCTFCSVLSFNGPSVRRRSVRSVVDEIKYLVQERGVQVIEWLDDDLLFGRQESEHLFRTMAEELPDDFEWIANNGVIAGAVTEEIMYWMVKSGCKAFKVGIESGNEAMLRKIKKPATKTGLLKAGEIFAKYPEVFVSGNFIVGFPEETFGEMMDTFNFANELSWDWANYYICQPLPGTEIFDVFQSLGDSRCDEDYYAAYNPGKGEQQKGNFGYYRAYHTDLGGSNPIRVGREVFDLPLDLVPSPEQIKEIWFTFNMESNFLRNKNFQEGGNTKKIVDWFESIAASYPRDAGMCAMLAHGHQLLGDQGRAGFYRQKYLGLVDEFDYWKRRVQEFPDLALYAGRSFPNRES